jgi:hypothetical protein
MHSRQVSIPVLLALAGSLVGPQRHESIRGCFIEQALRAYLRCGVLAPPLGRALEDGGTRVCTAASGGAAMRWYRLL